jgi:hypothetical protein
VLFVYMRAEYAEYSPYSYERREAKKYSRGGLNPRSSRCKRDVLTTRRRERQTVERREILDTNSFVGMHARPPPAPTALRLYVARRLAIAVGCAVSPVACWRWAHAAAQPNGAPGRLASVPRSSISPNHRPPELTVWDVRAPAPPARHHHRRRHHRRPHRRRNHRLPPPPPPNADDGLARRQSRLPAGSHVRGRHCDGCTRRTWRLAWPCSLRSRPATRGWPWRTASAQRIAGRDNSAGAPAPAGPGGASPAAWWCLARRHMLQAQAQPGASQRLDGPCPAAVFGSVLPAAQFADLRAQYLRVVDSEYEPPDKEGTRSARWRGAARGS